MLFGHDATSAVIAASPPCCHTPADVPLMLFSPPITPHAATAIAFIFFDIFRRYAAAAYFIFDIADAITPPDAAFERPMPPLPS